jgi:hypothetical protein
MPASSDLQLYWANIVAHFRCHSIFPRGKPLGSFLFHGRFLVAMVFVPRIACVQRRADALHCEAARPQHNGVLAFRNRFQVRGRFRHKFHVAVCMRTV